MTISLIALGVMIFVLIAGSICRKTSTAVLLLLASIAGAVAGGFWIPPLRHFVEGTQLFLNLMLTVAAGMLFMSVLKENGALDLLTRKIVSTFYKSPSLLLILIMLLIMLPAMLTGSAPASVLSTGVLVAPILLKIGVPRAETAAILALGSLFGMVAPPVNVPAMLIGTGVYMPYEGFAIPLLVLSMPLAVFSVLWIGRKYVTTIDRDEILSEIPSDPSVKGFLPQFPLVFVIGYMIIKSYFPQIDPGTPLVFFIGVFVAMFCGRKINIFTVAKNSMAGAIEVMALFAAVGTLIQIMGLTGARGVMVLAALSLSGALLYLSITLVTPLVGGLLMPFGAAGVLGIPLIMAFTNKNAIWVTSALTLLMSVGALLPPTSVSGLFAAKVLQLDEQSAMLKKCALPAILSLILGAAVLVLA